jgi:alkylation response protein AidB-like acyl-CoA dehydrogenase
MRTLNFRIAADVEAGRMDVALASTAKVYGSETVIEVLRQLIEIVGAVHWCVPVRLPRRCWANWSTKCARPPFPPSAVAPTRLQRELIAQFGLGMPRPVR